MYIWVLPRRTSGDVPHVRLEKVDLTEICSYRISFVGTVSNKVLYGLS